VVRRHAEGDARGADLSLRANEPLGHRRLGHEEGAGDLVGGQPAEGAEGERDLRLARERRVAAREDQAQSLVGDGIRLLRFRLRPGFLQRRQQLGFVSERALTPDPVDRAVACCRQQPRAGVVGGAVAWPALERGREGLLYRVLGEINVAEGADEDRERAPPFLPEDRFYQPPSSKTMIGLTSTEP
jgi:hypothetical protein